MTKGGDSQESNSGYPDWIARYCNLLPGIFWWECKRQLLVQGVFCFVKKDIMVNGQFKALILNNLLLEGEGSRAKKPGRSWVIQARA